MDLNTKLDKIACNFINNTCEEGFGNFFNETFMLLSKIHLRLPNADKDNFERAIRVFSKYHTSVID